MKILILKENLKTGLNFIERIIPKSFSLPILNNVLLSTENNFLNLAATDLEIGVRYWILAKIEDEGKIVVPAKFLSGFINSLPENKILFETRNNILQIKTKSFKTEIKGFSPDEFPIIPKIEKEEFLEINSALFCQGLNQVSKFTTINQSRPEISGVYLSFQKNQIQMAATDSFRLAEKTLVLKTPLRPDFKENSVILPQKTVQELITVGLEEGQKLKIYLDTNQIMFEFKKEGAVRPHLQSISRLIEGEYPNYQEIIPKKYETQIVLNKEEFLNHLKVASFFGGRINEARLDIDPSKGEMTIFSQSPEIGENQSLLQGRISGQKLQISFNWKFLIEGLANIQSPEVVFELNGEEGPAALKPVGDQSLVYIVMPIKGS